MSRESAPLFGKQPLAMCYNTNCVREIKSKFICFWLIIFVTVHCMMAVIS